MVHYIKKTRTPQNLKFFLDLLISFGISTNICEETNVNSNYFPKTRHNGLQRLMDSPNIKRITCIFCRMYKTNHSLPMASVREIDGFGLKSCMNTKGIMPNDHACLYIVFIVEDNKHKYVNV